ECVLVSSHMVSKDSKVGARRIALCPTQFVQVSALLETAEDIRYSRSCIRKRCTSVLHARLARPTQQHLPAVLEFGRDDLQRDALRPFRIREREMLCAPQQHIAAGWSFDTRFESPIAIQPDQAAAILGAALDQEWSHSDPPEDHDPAESQQRQPELQLAIHFDLDSIVIEMQHCALCLHIERIEKFPHHNHPFRLSKLSGWNSARWRYRSRSRWAITFGRQACMSEQLAQRASFGALGSCCAISIARTASISSSVRARSDSSKTTS